ncbi:MAG TPA: class I SAM-dependent RNA methyltransferase [Aggregatilineales bacterium]|nr:class I SAM-dependent RNA methyltransferase [Aggregatilineales bacterium]
MSETFELVPFAMAHGGATIGRHEGRVVFVPYAIPGERLRVEIVEDKGRFVNARIVEIIEPSPDRVEPPCPHFGPGLCGGCSFQHIAYERQLEIKRSIVQDQLERIGKFEGVPVHPTIPSPEPWQYRSYATFTMTDDGKPAFYSDDNRRLVPIEVCYIIHPALLELFEMMDFEPGNITRMKLQVGSDPEDRMLVIETVDDLPPEIEVDFPVSINMLLSDNEPVNLIGRSSVRYQVFNRTFRVTAGAFFHANVPVVEALVELVLGALNLQGDEVLLDLYSGVGVLTAFLAERADLVVSVESYPPAVTDAEVNLDDLENVDLVEGPVEAVLEDLEGPFDAIVLDPPPGGLSVEAIDELGRLAAPVLVYVSSDPATLARDARRLVDNHGYQLVEVQPVDMHPQAHHVMCVAVLRHA